MLTKTKLIRNNSMITKNYYSNSFNISTIFKYSGSSSSRIFASHLFPFQTATVNVKPNQFADVIKGITKISNALYRHDVYVELGKNESGSAYGQSYLSFTYYNDNIEPINTPEKLLNILPDTDVYGYSCNGSVSIYGFTNPIFISKNLEEATKNDMPINVFVTKGDENGTDYDDYYYAISRVTDNNPTQVSVIQQNRILPKIED